MGDEQRRSPGGDGVADRLEQRRRVRTPDGDRQRSRDADPVGSVGRDGDRRVAVVVDVVATFGEFGTDGIESPGVGHG